MTRIALCMFLFVVFALSAGAQYTIINGHLEGNIAGWDGTSVGGRENGAFQAHDAYQAINSSFDTGFPSSGSCLFTADASICSLTQQLGFTAAGQTLSLSADIAWDGDWSYLVFGFYEDNNWDVIINGDVPCAFDITRKPDLVNPIIPPDTDGTLDSFKRVTIKDVTLTSTGNPVRVFFGTSTFILPGISGVGAKTPGTSKFAVDNVTPDYDPTAILLNPPAAVDNWYMY